MDIQCRPTTLYSVHAQLNVTKDHPLAKLLLHRLDLRKGHLKEYSLLCRKYFSNM